MTYSSFEHHFPDVARRETRTITFFSKDHDVPESSYGLIELYCNDPGCDCRRVMLNVTSLESGRLEAVIAFGWEDEGFYRRWYGRDDPEIVEHMKGPILNRGSPLTENSDLLLAEVADKVLSQPSYIARLKRHYEMFRKAIDSPRQEPVQKTGPQTGRNDKCPCGSGRKFKVCCGKRAAMG